MPPKEDIFMGADDDECKSRKRFQALLFLGGARMRIRIARRRIGISRLTDREIKLLNYLLNEVGDLLKSRSPL